MGSAFVVVRKWPSGKRTYQARYRLGGRESKERSGGSFQTLRAAESRANMLRLSIARGEIPDLLLETSQSMGKCLTDAANEYLTTRVDLDESSLKTYRNGIDRFGRLGGKCVDNISASDIQSWINYLSSGADDGQALKPATVRKYLDVVRAVIDYSDIYPNPSRSPRIRIPKQSKEEVSPPSYDEFSSLVSHVGAKWSLHLRTMESSSLRVSELLSATWGDLDVAGSRLRVARSRTKGGTGGRRWVSLPDDILSDIESLIPPDERGNDERIFSGSDSAIRQAMRRACIDKGIPHYSPHDLRHRFISLRVMAGWSISMISKAAGHSRASVTLDIYSHVLTDEPQWLLAQVKESEERTRRAVSVLSHDPIVVR